MKQSTVFGIGLAAVAALSLAACQKPKDDAAAAPAAGAAPAAAAAPAAPAAAAAPAAPAADAAPAPTEAGKDRGNGDTAK